MSFVVGLIIGGIVGIVLMCCMITAKQADEKMGE